MDERVASRRRKLLEVGFEVIGDPGLADDPPIILLCAQAEISSRYFQESFCSKEELSSEVFDYAMTKFEDATSKSGRSDSEPLETMLARVVSVVRNDVRIGHLLFSRRNMNPTVVSKRADLAATLLTALGIRIGRNSQSVATIFPVSRQFLVGGIAYVLSTWIDEDFATPEEIITKQLIQIIEGWPELIDSQGA
ncbi:hypothetical protein [Mycobacteroides abscessus]|uniref:hypothetical protein n=1 Tax=Mycobacteroides abscessus TaxID=36809 RepID=UPI00104621EF|nr:hypothetical protein [Mycobacteroides abscessus]